MAGGVATIEVQLRHIPPQPQPQSAPGAAPSAHDLVVRIATDSETDPVVSVIDLTVPDDPGFIGRVNSLWHTFRTGKVVSMRGVSPCGVASCVLALWLVALCGIAQSQDKLAFQDQEGVRWYDIRLSGNPDATCPTYPCVYQQGTLADVPSGRSRFMPSLAMDTAENILVGYSTSGKTAGSENHSSRYTANYFPLPV